MPSEKHNLGMPALYSIEWDECFQHILMIPFKLVLISSLLILNDKNYIMLQAWLKYISFYAVGVYIYLSRFIGLSRLNF